MATKAIPKPPAFDPRVFTADGGERLPPVDDPWSHGDEIDRVGDDLIHKVIAPTRPPGDIGTLVLVDVISGAYVLGQNESEMLRRLRAERPGGAYFLGRLGYVASYGFGRVPRIGT